MSYVYIYIIAFIWGHYVLNGDKNSFWFRVQKKIEEPIVFVLLALKLDVRCSPVISMVNFYKEYQNKKK